MVDGAPQHLAGILLARRPGGGVGGVGQAGGDARLPRHCRECGQVRSKEDVGQAGVQATERALEPRLRAVGELFDDLSPAEQRRFLSVVETLLDGLRRRGQLA